MSLRMRSFFPAAFFLLAPLCFAAPPQTINYQGYLTGSGGAPVTGAVVMTFKLYNAASGSVPPLWTETQLSANVVNGNFNVALGSVTSFALPFDVPYWLGVTINADPEMAPRQPLASSAYAIHAITADALSPAAMIAGSQVVGTISVATLPTTSLTGTVSSMQIANNAVTQAKLSPVSGASPGKVLGTDGSNLQWQNGSTGTVTSVTTGIGLSGGPITGAGTISLVDAYKLPQSCIANQIPKFNATSGIWECQNDNAGPPNVFVQGGNTFGVPAVLGTNDAQPLKVVSAGAQVSVEISGGNGLHVIQSTGPISNAPNVVNGSANNGARGQGATVSGGGFAGNSCIDPATGVANGPCGNRANNSFATVGGGGGNIALGGSSTISGGDNNNTTAVGFASTIGGGEINAASAYAATVGGGHSNSATGPGATVAGGNSNNATNTESVVSGGFSNSAIAPYAAVAGGSNNSAFGGYGAVGGGFGNVAFGLRSTVPGGDSNRASGISSFAAGTHAGAQHDGAFVWADSQNPDYLSNSVNSFNIRASGGVHINTDSVIYFGNQTRQMLNLWGPTSFGTAYGIGVQGDTLYYRSNNEFCWFVFGSHSNAQCDPGAGGGTRMRLNGFGLSVNGVFISSSDRNLKENFNMLDVQAMLAKVVALPLTAWNFKDDELKTRHLGPMAQDFKRLFGLGQDDKTIATVDANGVALAAIQGLNEKLETESLQRKAKDTRIDALEKANAALQTELATIKRKLGL